MADRDRFSSYTFSEGRTGGGQLVEFTCPSVAAEVVRNFLATHVREITLPTTGRVNVEHGGYGQYTRFEVTQHKYAGGGGPGRGGYIEVLKVKSPPDGRCGVIINEHSSNVGTSAFSEWAGLEEACAAFEEHWGSSRTAEAFPTLPGFLRRVPCGLLRPWFYAIGEEQLIGDYAFPEGLQDDAVFRFGRLCVVYDHDGKAVLKTCMGTRFVNGKNPFPPHEERRYRLVSWDDGSVWEEGKFTSVTPPRPLAEDEEWIAEASRQFQELLAGRSTRFTIHFTDGNAFVGQLVQPRRRRGIGAAGRYYAVVRLRGEKKILEGWVDFTPTSEVPDVSVYIIQRYAHHGKEVERLEVKKRRKRWKGKEWSGTLLCFAR